jgi:beta-phosphoglucomutase-like phosphatase (HAD superfamily)
MAGDHRSTRGDLIELSRTVDHALSTHHRSEAVAGAEELLEALFAHRRSVRYAWERRDSTTAIVVETATIEMIAEVALAIGELNDGNRWPAPRLRAHVDQLFDIESDCGLL